MILIVNYDAGNLKSVSNALSHLGFKHIISKDAKDFDLCDKIIFPGVGAAKSAMESLKKDKLDIALNQAFSEGKKILGICLGTQIIMDFSMEDQTNCLGFIEGECKMFDKNLNIKVPHMGWNKIFIKQKHILLDRVSKDDEFYFVHSYYPVPKMQENIIAETQYQISFPSVVAKDNLFATQFHLEKSGRAGLKILENFCKWE